MVLRDRTGIKGSVRAMVISLDPVGAKEFEELRRYWGDPAPGVKTEDANILAIRKAYRRNPVYQKAREVIYAEHGFQKKRTTWNVKVFVVMLQCAIRKKFSEALQVLRYEMGINHNIVTDQGDAMIADLMQETPTQDKVDNTNGHIEVGTGWTGTTPKQNEICNTSIAVEVMDATYPKTEGAFGAANDNVAQYRASFEAGEAEATDLDEAALLNHLTPASGDCLAYGQITPAVTVGASDTLQVDWELTVLGA